jgi:hypothetical protein
LWHICKKVVPLNVSPKWPILAYAAVRPVNQSLVIQTAGIIYLWQQYSKHALLNTAIYVTKNGGRASG